MSHHFWPGVFGSLCAAAAAGMSGLPWYVGILMYLALVAALTTLEGVRP